MRSPFPGMDPYLESPVNWPDFHNRFAVAIADALSPLVAPRYYVGVERRAYFFEQGDFVLIGFPDVAVTSRSRGRRLEPAPLAATSVLDVEVPTSEEVKELFLEVRETTSKDLVTVLELLSPANKLHWKGREDYLKKRGGILDSRTSLVELDLLRVGKPMPLVRTPPPSDYRILVSRGSERPRARLHAFNLRESVPNFALPLLPGDTEPEVEPGKILHALYTRARFDLCIDYSSPPVPPLASKDAAWARRLLQASGKLTPPVASPRVREKKRARKPSRRAVQKTRRR